MSLYSQKTFDAELELKAAGLVAASANSDIIYVGPGLVDGDLIIDVTEIEVASGNEIYTITLEGSNTADMSAGSVALVTKVLGNLVDPMDAALSTTGRYVIPFRNEEGGTLYSYLRVRTVVAGTIATGINFSAFLAKK